MNSGDRIIGHNWNALLSKQESVEMIHFRTQDYLTFEQPTVNNAAPVLPTNEDLKDKDGLPF